MFSLLLVWTNYWTNSESSISGNMPFIWLYRIGNKPLPESIMTHPPPVDWRLYASLGINLLASIARTPIPLWFTVKINTGIIYHRADSTFPPSQWETALLCNDVSHWVGASLESALYNVCHWTASNYWITSLVLDHSTPVLRFESVNSEPCSPDYTKHSS